MRYSWYVVNFTDRTLHCDIAKSKSVSQCELKTRYSVCVWYIPCYHLRQIIVNIIKYLYTSIIVYSCTIICISISLLYVNIEMKRLMHEQTEQTNDDSHGAELRQTCLLSCCGSALSSSSRPSNPSPFLNHSEQGEEGQWLLQTVHKLLTVITWVPQFHYAC